MEELDRYRSEIEKALREHAKVPYAYGDIQSKLILDRSNDQYLLIDVGWDDGLRVHGCLIHIEIIDGKIWIQRDGTEEGIAKSLVAAGIPKDRIVLAFHAIERRPYTGYAVA